MSEFVSVEKLINRDVPEKIDENNIKKDVLFQIQSEKGDKHCKIVNVGKYTHVPIIPILDFDHLDHKCSLFSFTLTYDELIQDNHFKMICFIIKKQTSIVGSLELVFEPIIKMKNYESKIVNGSFKIILNKIDNDKNTKKVIKTYTEYPGKEESIYLLTSILVEENVIEKIAEKRK